MGVTVAIIICAIAIGIFAQASTGGSRAGLIWGSIHFAISSLLSIMAYMARPYIFPEAFRPAQGIFEKKLSTGQMVISFFIDKTILYGPLVVVTALLFLMVCTAVKGSARRGHGAQKLIDWRARIR